MGKWTNEGIAVEPIEFDGDKVQFTLKRLRVEDMGLMAKNFDAVNKTMRFSDPLEMCQLSSKVLPKYIVSMSGYKKGDGSEMTLEEFLQEAITEFYFVPLVSKLFGSLVSISTIPKDTEKNLPPPSPESLGV